MRSRTVARLIGLASGIVGLAGWIWALSVVAAMPPVHPVTITFLAIMLLAIGGVAVGAYQYNSAGRTAHLVLFAVATLLLVVGTILSGFSVGLAFLPASTLALVAALFTALGRIARKP